MEKSSHRSAHWSAAPEEHFTGEVSIAPLGDPGEGIKVSAVRFEAGARTDWHSHPSGQVLHVVAGRGQVVTADGTRADIGVGDTVTTPPGEVHWHGAAPDQSMTHLSVISGDAVWREKVGEDEYRG